MKIIKKENIGIQQVYNTNVEDAQNYIGNNVINHNCVVDYLYQGEIHLSVINVSSSVVRIYEDMKLLQFLETPVFNSDIEIVHGCIDSTTSFPQLSEEFYKGMSTERGADGFGSSDNKTIKNKK